MRIEKVVIENLNSLAGRFEIDLTDRAYAGGLFAIVGPSGAGKTTVLDAICLALYGKTPRIESVSIEHDELMNKGAKDCRAEAVFTAGGKRYRSIFVHERAKGLKPFRPTKRELLIQSTDGLWHVLAAAVREVEEKIKEVTGLDYHQFTRSIMLAQFRFAEFLQADSTDRAKILEKMTDMDIYRRISVAVYERTQRQKQQLFDTRRRIDGMPILSEAEEAARKREGQQLETAAAAHEALKDALARCGAMAQQLSSLNKELDRYKQERQPLTDRRDQRRVALTAAEQGEKTSKAAQDALLKTLIDVRALDIKASNKDDEVKRIEREIVAAHAKVMENKQAVLDIFKKYEKEASDETYYALYHTENISGQLRGKAKAALDAAAARSQGIEAEIAKALAQQDEQQWRSLLEQLKKALPVAEAADVLKNAQEQLAELKKQQATLVKEMKELEPSAKELEDKYEYARLNRRFGEERRKLEDGRPCPLCGALHHPMADQATDDDYYEKAKREFDEMQRKKDGVNNRSREIELRIGDQNALINEKTSYLGENKTIVDGLDGLKSSDEVVKAVDDIERRLRSLSRLQSSKILAAENVAAMTARFGDVDKDVAMIDSRKRNIADAENDKKQLHLQKAQTQSELDTLTARRKALFGDKDADAEEAAAAKAQKSAQAAKEQAREMAEQAERALIQNGQDILRTQGEAGALEVKLKADYETAAAAAVNVQNVSDDDDVVALFGRYSQEAVALSAQPDTDALERVQRLLAALISGETARLGSVKQIIKTNAESRQTVKLLKAQEKGDKQALDKWEKLNALIGSAKGDKFTRLAQSITFDALLRYANISLKRMSNRYILVRDGSGPDKPLELAVIDMDQAGETRPVSNLSGGESFIVSMALALGLSEMSSGAARIDSLFIDEGFASLDENYMEAALQTLFALGNREGKLIGVISHVEALKNRIDVQIEVRPRSGGCSELFGPGVRYG